MLMGINSMFLLWNCVVQERTIYIAKHAAVAFLFSIIYFIIEIYIYPIIKINLVIFIFFYPKCDIYSNLKGKLQLSLKYFA